MLGSCKKLRPEKMGVHYTDKRQIPKRFLKVQPAGKHGLLHGLLQISKDSEVSHEGRLSGRRPAHLEEVEKHQAVQLRRRKMLALALTSSSHKKKRITQKDLETVRDE